MLNQKLSLVLAGLLSIWFLCLGLAILTRQHSWFLRFSRRQAARPFRWIWRHWHTQITWALIGAGVLLYYLVSTNRIAP
ncbi:hypothetical protein HYS99_00540 [Candidatus Giovannonibacteria bacterium]|nr:hypothetical protein [Candidatus Giovannonibacteria bacterium]